MNNDPGDPNGVVSLVEATALSINCAFLRLAHQVTLTKVIDVAKSMGLSDDTLNPINPSLVIGSEAVRPSRWRPRTPPWPTAAFTTRRPSSTGSWTAPGQFIYNGERPGRRVFSAQVADEAIVALQAPPSSTARARRPRLQTPTWPGRPAPPKTVSTPGSTG